MRWVVCVVTGMLVGTLAFVIDIFTDWLIEARVWLAARAVDAINGSSVDGERSKDALPPHRVLIFDKLP